MSELDFWNYQLGSFDPDLSDTDSSWSCGPPQASLNHGPEGFPRPTAAPPGPPRNSVPLRARMATVDSSSKAKGKQVRLEQERQARGTSMTGNAPNAEIDDAYQEAEEEAFEHRERRYQAALILESYERLAWHANTRNESIPQTRLHFEKILAGMDSAEESEGVEWEDDYLDSDDPASMSKSKQKAGSGDVKQQQGSRGGSRSGSGLKRAEKRKGGDRH